MPAAFAALYIDHVDAQFDHLLRMFDRADGGDAQDARILETADHLGIGATAKADRAHLILVGEDQLDNLVGAGLKAVEVDAEGLVGAFAHGEDFFARFVRRHHRCAQKTERACIARPDHQRRLGDPAHRGLDDRPAAAKPFGQYGVQRIAHHSLACFLFASAIFLASRPAIELPWTRSFWAWAKWCI